MDIKELFFISLFGVFGVLARFATNVSVNNLLPGHHWTATLIVNGLGSFLIGLVWVFTTERGLISPSVYVMLAVGFLGGFTTFSSFSLDVLRLFQAEEAGKAMVYWALSPALGVALVYFGVFVARRYP